MAYESCVIVVCVHPCISCVHDYVLDCGVRAGVRGCTVHAYMPCGCAMGRLRRAAGIPSRRRGVAPQPERRAAPIGDKVTVCVTVLQRKT